MIETDKGYERLANDARRFFIYKGYDLLLKSTKGMYRDFVPCPRFGGGSGRGRAGVGQGSFFRHKIRIFQDFGHNL